MRASFLAPLVWLLLGAVPPPVPASADAVQVLAIGTNQSFKGNLKALKFAETDAKRFAEAMQTVGLVPSVRATVVTDATVRDFRDAFRGALALEAQAPASDAHARKFIFYFSGHSDDTGLHMKDGLITKAELHDQLSALRAHTKVAILDSCFSGAITAKGVEPAPGFELPKMELDEPSGSVFLSASSGRQLAYESDDLGGSVFTHHLLAGLYGEADGNGDGVVTVDELYQHVYRNTKWQSLNYPTQSAQEPEYVAKLQGQGAIVLSFPARTNSRLTLEKDLKGEITIASPKGIQFFKVQKIDGQEKTIQLPVGAYQLSVRDGDKVGEGKARLEPARLAFLAKNDLVWRDASFELKGAAKGEDTVAAPGVSAFKALLGAHSGYSGDGKFGPFVELAWERRFAPGSGRFQIPLGWALSFHRNGDLNGPDAEGGDEQDDSAKAPQVTSPAALSNPHVTTDSTALYVTSGLGYKAPWRAVPARFSLDAGAGQGYHDQRYRYDDGQKIHQGGLVPAFFWGFGASLESGGGRRMGLVYRHELMNTMEVSDTGRYAGADVVAFATDL